MLVGIHTLEGGSLMGLPRRRPTEHPKDRALRFHIDTIRRKDVQHDRDGSYFERCAELAESLGIEIQSVFEEWSERAAVRTYLGDLDVDAAESAAFEDVKERLCGR